MEVDEKPTEEYGDIGGCDEQIQELIEAVVLPMTHKDMFDTIGIKPPKGVLLFGPPGTGKTLLGALLVIRTVQAMLVVLLLTHYNSFVLAFYRYYSSSVCQSDQCHFSQNSRSAVGSNVYW
jgi:predicted ATPase